MTVISFVMLATGSCSCAFEDASTVPSAAFTTVKARASTVGGAARAGVARTSATARTNNARLMPAEGYFTRMCWPTRSPVGLTFGLSRSSAATLVCVFAAMTEKLSPRWTT